MVKINKGELTFGNKRSKFIGHLVIQEIKEFCLDRAQISEHLKCLV